MILSFLYFLVLEPVPFPSNGLQGDALARYIEARINEQGSTPVIENAVFHFFYQASEGETPKILGDFDRWRRGRNPTATPMIRLTDDWYHFGVAVRPQTRIEYLIETKGVQSPDPRNPHQVMSFFGPISVAQMPDHPKHPELVQQAGVPRGNLESFRFKSQFRRNERDVQVYTPPHYEDAREKLPTLYFGDGGGYLKMGNVPIILDNLIAEGKIPPVIAVFVAPVDRWLEYRMFTLYRLMLLEELIPHLTEKWRIDNQRQVIIGSSRGGLSAIDLVVTHPDRFIGCIAFAPAATETDFLTQLQRMEGDPRPQIHILSGTYDFWLPSSRAIFEIMKKKGYQVAFREEPIGHSIPAWRGYLDELLPPILTAKKVP